MINYWYTRFEANRAGLKAVLLNRIGDVFMYIFFLFFITYFSTLDFNIAEQLIMDVKYRVLEYKDFSISVIDLLAFCLFIGAIAKSSQFGFHV